MFLLYNCLFTFNNFYLYSIFVHYYSISGVFIFDVLHLYSLVKAQQNLQNDICALLGLMGVFAMGLAYRGGKDEGWSYDEWLWLGRGNGLGRAVCVWCWDSVGKAVDVPIHRYSTYPHPIPIQHQGSPDPAFTT